jgi:hypothetical protein
MPFVPHIWTDAQVSNGGLIFIRGAAGTRQEIFQAACHNHYNTPMNSTPMVFYGTEVFLNFKKNDGIVVVVVVFVVVFVVVVVVVIVYVFVVVVVVVVVVFAVVVVVVVVVIVVVVVVASSTSHL